MHQPGTTISAAPLTDESLEALRGITVITITPEPLVGHAVNALLDRFGISTRYAETTARAGRMLVGEGDILLWLVRTLDADELQQAIELKRLHPGLGLCFLADAADASALRELVAVDPERFAFLTRRNGTDVRELGDALVRISEGRGVLDGALLRSLLGEPRDSGCPLTTLSTCEREVLELLAQGYRNREIARRLWKREKTIEKHVRSVFQKLGLGPERAIDLDRRVTAARIYMRASGFAQP